MKTTKNLNIWLAMSMFLLLMVSTATAKIIFVDDNATGANSANDGSSWADAYSYLQDALADANYSPKPVEISVAQGIYKPDQGAGITPGDQDATFQLINGVTIKGGYAGFGEPDANARDIELYETILSGDLDGNDIDVNEPWDLWDEPTRAENSYHVVTGSDVNEAAVLDGFTIAGGNAPSVPNHTGGGMFIDQGSPSVTNCTFIGNLACTGGGMYCYKSNNQILTNCTFSGNSGRWFAGGICIVKSNATLIDCTFSGNSAHSDGGGILSASSHLTLNHCIFSGNRTDYSIGGIYIDYFYSHTVITNCVFSGNVNCGIFNGLNELLLTNCTFVGNLGAGLSIPPIPVPSAKSSSIYSYGNSFIKDCIFWKNWPQQISDPMNFSSVAYSDVQGGWGGFENIDCDPCFVDLGYWDDKGTPDDLWDDFWVDGDYRLLPSSPCINAGDPNYIGEPNETDLDGRPRVIGGRIDMGAYEYSPAIPAEVRIVPRTINLASKGRWITCYIRLGEEYDVADIDPNSILLEGEIEADSLRVDEEKQVAIVRFSRSEVQGILAPGEVELTISGELTDGTRFEGTDTIRVIDKGEKK